MSSFREPYDRLVSSLLYCRLNAVTRGDPLCGTRYLDARNATVRMWARHWGNYLLRDLLLYPPLLRAAHPRPLPKMPATGPVWYHLKAALGDGGEGFTPAGAENARRVAAHIRNGSLYDAFLVYDRWNESVEVLDFVLPLQGTTWARQLTRMTITHADTSNSIR